MSIASEPNSFFAYAEKPDLRAETIRAAIESLNSRGSRAVGWEDLNVEGTVLISTLCDAIDSSTAIVADVSTMNSNVLFEAGFALGRNKVLWFALDESDTEATKAWTDVSILSTVGRFDYSGNSEKLVSRILEVGPERQFPVLLDTLLAGAAARESNAVFAPSLPTKFNAAAALEKMLDRQGHLKILGSSDDLGLAPLQFYVQEIYRSSAAIFHLLAPNRIRAAEHNARASFLAGIAHGLELPLLMVVEHGFTAPIDYKDLLFVYKRSVDLQAHVTNWLNTLPKAEGSNKRLGRLALDVELPLRTFGQYVAEYEVKELNDYFIPTNEFESILTGAASVFAGRKGTGKTATMSQAVVELRKDRRNLVVPIKPSSYEITGLLELLTKLQSDSTSEYLLVNLWSYLIYTEVAIRAVLHARDRAAGIGQLTPMRDLEEELDALGVGIDTDLATRLESAVAGLLSTSLAEADAKASIANQLRVQRLGRLQELIGNALHDFDRVAVLIDNLDKGWERGVDFALMSKFILSLLTTSGRLEKQFSRPSKSRKSINLTLSVFLRSDIFDVVVTHAREPDKIGELTVHWQDEELLARVLHERYNARREDKGRKSHPDMWTELFASEVRGSPTRDYLLWRTLPRPRDLIFFANAALTTAINRKHDLVQASDVIFAEAQYSRFAYDALLVEGEAQGFDLEEVLYEFVGLDSTLDSAELDSALAVSPQPAEVRSWLIKTSFLGLETDDGAFTHVEGEKAAKRKLRVAERLATRLGRPLRFRIHPAFRGYLDVHDDDLHVPGVVDATLGNDR